MYQGIRKLSLILISGLILSGGFFVFQQKMAQAATGINKEINFQGKVVNTDGTNVANANYNFVFSIYSQQAPGGSVIWTENKSLTVTDGIFQTNLGDVTSLPASVDFNTDNIYLGINFNSNGEMVPRVKFTAAPYAMNAAKVGGLTVTDTTGTLTIQNGKTVSFADAFSTGGLFPLNINTIGTTNVTLPTSGTLVANPMTTLGDIIYGGVSGAPMRLGGSAGFLTSTGSSAPTWTATSTDYFSQYALLSGRAGGQTLIGGTVANNVLTIQGNSASGNTASNSSIVFKVGNSGITTALSLLNSGAADFNHNEAKNFRVENANGSVLTPTCDVANQGRMYYDTNARSAFVCIETSPSVFGWFDYTATSVYSNKVVTVGTGGDYATIAAGAGYLNTLGGGIMLLTPETHNVTNSVDLSNINLIGANTGDTRINITGAGVLRVKETQFKSLTIYVDASITASAGIDAKYSASTTTSVIFEWVDFITNGTKVLINSSEATKPVIRTRFISVSATAGTQKIMLPKASANISASSTNFVESQGGSGTLDMEDWDVKIAGSSNIKTSGTVTTIPDSTIYVYPGMNIQAAINSVSSGGVITLLPGIHNISSTLLVNKDNIQIQGYGDASVVRASGFIGSDTTAAIQIGSVDGATPNNSVILSDFRLEVSGTGASDIHGVRVAGGSDNQLLNLTVVKTSGASGTAAGARMGVLMMDGTTQKLTRPVVKGCLVMGTSSAVAYFTDGIHVTGGASYGVGSGIFTNGQGVEAALVEGNQVDYVRETVAVFVGVNNSSLYNNRFSRMGAGGGGAFGVFFGNSSNVNMTANVVSNSLSAASYGLVIDTINSGSLKQVTDSVFTANVIDGSANGGAGFSYGVSIGATANTAFHRNIFTNNTINGASNATTTAITVTGNADDNNFSNNVFNGNANAWDTGISIVSTVAERNFIGKNAFINTTVTLTDAGTGTQSNVAQHNAVVNPTTTDDNSLGYVVGTVWVNTTAQSAYIATSVATGAAAWKQIDNTGGSAGGVSLAPSSADVDSSTNPSIFINDTAGGNLLQLQAGAVNRFVVGNTGTVMAGAYNGLTLTSAVDGFTIAGGTTSRTLTITGGNASLSGSSSGTNTGDITIAGQNYLSLSGQAITANAIDLSGTNATGTLAAARFPALTGDVTTVAGSLVTTLADSGVSIGTYRSVTVDSKGRVTGGTNPTTMSGYGLTDVVQLQGATPGTQQIGNLNISGTGIFGGLTINSAAGLTSNQATMVINATGTVDVQDILNADSISSDAGVSIAAGQSYTGTGAVILSSAAATGLTINSGTTGTISIGDDTSAETINLGTGAAAKTLLIGSTNSTSTTTIQAGSGGITLSDTTTLATGADLVTSNLGVNFTDSDTNPTCVVGEYKIYADTSEAKLKKCVNGTVTDLVGDDMQRASTQLTASSLSPANTPEYLGNVSITPTSATGDVFVQANIFTNSISATNQTITMQLRALSGTTCAGALLSSSTMTLTSASGSDGPTGSVTYLEVNPGAVAQGYAVCAQSTTNNAVTAGGTVYATVIDNGADLAEVYSTNDVSIEAGDVVAYDPTIAEAGMKKSAQAYDEHVFGVITTNPGIVIGNVDKVAEKALPVALAGRIPVKVTAENGQIKAGDYLTASSIPGVAMKATKAGTVVGQALQDIDLAAGEIGKVMTFIKNGNFNGERLMDNDGATLSGTALLQKLLFDKSQTGDISATSEIVTDRVVAGQEIVTPQLVADSIIVRTIRAEHIEGLEIMETGIANAQDAAENNAGEVKSLGQQVLEIQKTLKSLSDKSANFIVNSLVEFRGQVIFKSVVAFMDKVVFHKEVEFAGQVTFNQDMAGYAIIKEGQDSIKVTFEKEYEAVPIVNATLSLQQIENDELRKAAEELLLVTDVKYIITNVTEKGFEIRINQKTFSDIPFSWQAMAVKNPQTASEDKKEDIKIDQIVTEVIAPIKTESASEPAITAEKPATEE